MRVESPLALLALFYTTHSLKPTIPPQPPQATCETPHYDGVVEVQVIVHETPAGCPVVVETLVERPTVVEILPGYTLTVTDVPTCIATTVVPTASICSTEYATARNLRVGTQARLTPDV
ncbi:hypothetical protein JDV02_010611 [Purpureocillium takamizusanense]|uniref:Uncharacterized protein n=1 Tax=Purpureocillium takamizusanense TaxID=2060973 RepID=A0A9Q8QUT5_9HYPO|nr:uncharacterized protein JDV02_010611 [Purpureocillium takamizusanense]UNI24892.1 hypothetical protein JDV02_010611 [Purpureocillium takamizusanense]